MNYCGTPRGMDEHKKTNTPPCKWCKAATEKPAPLPAQTKAKLEQEVAAAKEDRRKRLAGNKPRIRGVKPPCGTEKGYDWHRRRDEPIDDACREAANIETNRRYKERQARYAHLPKRSGKLTEAEVLQIVELVRKGADGVEVAARFGVHPSAVSKIMCGDRWSKITGIQPGQRRKVKTWKADKAA